VEHGAGSGLQRDGGDASANRAGTNQPGSDASARPADRAIRRAAGGEYPEFGGRRAAGAAGGNRAAVRQFYQRQYSEDDPERGAVTAAVSAVFERSDRRAGRRQERSLDLPCVRAEGGKAVYGRPDIPMELHLLEAADRLGQL